MKASTAAPLLLMPTASDPVEQKETALVTIEPKNALAVFTDKEKADAILAKIKKIVAEFKGDATTAKGRAEIASMAYKIARSKTYVEAERKKLADYHKELPKKIDATGKHFRDEFEKLQDEVRKPLTDWENAEKARVQGIKDRIEVMRQHASMTDDSGMIKAAIVRVEAVVIDESFAEFVSEAAIAKDAALADLRVSLEFATKRESEAAELTRLREEQAKRDQADREAKIAQEAAEKATRDAEEKAAREKAESEARELRAKLAQEQAEREAQRAKDDAERKAKEAVEAEKRRVEAEAARLREEEAKREADKSNQFRVHSEAVDDLQAIGIAKDLAIEIVYAVRDGKIRNLSLKY